MKTLLLIAAALTLPLPVAAEESAPTTRAGQQAFQQGFRDCAPDLDAAVKFVHEDDAAYSQLGTWSKDHPNGEVFNSLTAAPGTGVASFTGVKTAAGTCNTLITQVVPAPTRSCQEVQKTAFKDWKYFSDLGGAPVFEDPTSGNVNVVFVPLGRKSCLIVKQVVFFGR